MSTERREFSCRTGSLRYHPQSGEELVRDAGAIQYRYRMVGGRRERVVADFLIGAHALHHADRLIARDRGFYLDYFAGWWCGIRGCSGLK